jgi:hypothetical protein
VGNICSPASSYSPEAHTVPLAIAMQITGRKTDSMFRRYAIVAPNDVGTALRMTQEHTTNEMAQATATVN